MSTVTPVTVPFIHIFCKAADAIAAHLRLASVAVDDAHLDIRTFALQYDQKSVCADARLPVAEFRRNRVIIHRYLPSIQQDKIIAKSVNLCKMHR
jgi:hypothetical protein